MIQSGCAYVPGLVFAPAATQHGALRVARAAFPARLCGRYANRHLVLRQAGMLTRRYRLVLSIRREATSHQSARPSYFQSHRLPTHVVAFAGVGRIDECDACCLTLACHYTMSLVYVA